MRSRAFDGIGIVVCLAGGVWLLIERQTQPLFFGLFFVLPGCVFLRAAMLPGLPFAVAVPHFAERHRPGLARTFSVLSAAFSALVIAGWCTVVFFLFAQTRTGPPALILPRLLWSYGVAIGTLRLVGRQGGVLDDFVTLFASLGYLASIAADVIFNAAMVEGSEILALFAGCAVALSVATAWQGFGRRSVSDE